MGSNQLVNVAKAVAALRNAVSKDQDRPVFKEICFDNATDYQCADCDCGILWNNDGNAYQCDNCHRVYYVEEEDL